MLHNQANLASEVFKWSQTLLSSLHWLQTSQERLVEDVLASELHTLAPGEPLIQMF